MSSWWEEEKRIGGEGEYTSGGNKSRTNKRQKWNVKERRVAATGKMRERICERQATSLGFDA